MTRRLLLRGAPAPLAAALDRLHVACDVRGVIERDGEVEVWLDGAVPGGPEPGVERVELPLDERTWTGFEEDAVIVVAPDLIVRPPWVGPPAGFAGVDLVVPRGMAFGSGEHGSTQAALCALRACWPDPPPATFADVGTGSGILALYARHRGAGAILACDVERESVAAARALVPGAEVRLGRPQVLGVGGADLVVANLDARQLGADLDAILGVWRRIAPLVLSGMRPGEVDGVAPRVPCPERVRIERGGYVAVAFDPA